MSSDVDKALLAFLNGLAKRVYFGEEFSDEFLRTDVLTGISPEEYISLKRRYQNLLSALVSADMDYTQLDVFLTSQMKKRQGALSEKEAATVTRFWKTQRSKIHQHLVDLSTCDNRLKGVSWRIDVKMKSKHTDQINQPSAIVEMQLGKGKEIEMVRFEMDEKKLSELLLEVSKIEQAIDSFAQSS